jgi:hypothetical protein
VNVLDSEFLKDVATKNYVDMVINADKITPILQSNIPKWNKFFEMDLLLYKPMKKILI